jgi:uncharacterized membrane protein YgcG
MDIITAFIAGVALAALVALFIYRRADRAFDQALRVRDIAYTDSLNFQSRRIKALTEELAYMRRHAAPPAPRAGLMGTRTPPAPTPRREPVRRIWDAPPAPTPAPAPAATDTGMDFAMGMLTGAILSSSSPAPEPESCSRSSYEPISSGGGGDFGGGGASGSWDSGSSSDSGSSPGGSD